MFNGFEIGSCESFSASSSRTSERIREVLFKRGAETKEIVWGGTDTNITLNRVELYDTSVLMAFGYQIFSLEDMLFPIDISEIMQIPAKTPSTGEPPSGVNGVRVLTYKDAVATAWGKTIDQGTVRIVETMTFEVRVVRGRQLTGSTVPTVGNL
jgi:hypothetical protein